MRPFLVPGAHVLRRHDGTLQVGLDPRSAVVLPGDAGATSALARLDGSPATRDQPWLEVLGRAGLLVDERNLIPLVSGAGSTVDAGRVAALVREHRDRAAEVAHSRVQRRVAVAGFGPAGDALVDQARRLLDDSGLDATADAASAAVGVLMGVGEPERDLLDDWMRERVPHVVVRMTEGRGVVGPFVTPGTTACVRCVDAHHTDADPTWPLLVLQYAAACRQTRADGAPEPVDPALAAIAVAWAARDVMTYLEGGRPSLWSTTLYLDHGLAEVESRSWTRHPDCGCSWQ